MANDSASVIIPCCPKPGACIACCGDGTGVVFDLTGIEPSAGTYDDPDGGTVEIIRADMLPDFSHIRFGPALWPSGANKDAMGPLAYCCAYVIGFCEWKQFNSSAVETSYQYTCIIAGVISGCLVVDIGGQYWFYRDISASVAVSGFPTMRPQMARFCAKPRNWIDLSNDTDIALDSGIDLRVKGTDILDTGQEMATATTCANPCRSSYDVTITLSGFSGMVLPVTAFTDFTISDDTATFTATGTYNCGDNQTLGTVQFFLALTHATYTNACLGLTIDLTDNYTPGNYKISSSANDPSVIGIIFTDCDDPDSFLDDPFGQFSGFDCLDISCGDNGIISDGTMDFTWVNGSPGTPRTIDVDITAT